jgi:transcriptional regulator with XRE-family HTH domain
MDKLKLHWTEKSISSFVHRLSFDFITQIQQKLEKAHISNKEFAERLKVTPGRVSQVFNDPGNITLESAVGYARGIGMKVALIAYDDNDPENNKGPINSEIFYRCWQLQGTPQDFFELATVSTAQMMFDFAAYERTSANSDFGDLPQLWVKQPEQVAATWVN